MHIYARHINCLVSFGIWGVGSLRAEEVLWADIITLFDQVGAHINHMCSLFSFRAIMSSATSILAGLISTGTSDCQDGITSAVSNQFGEGISWRRTLNLEIGSNPWNWVTCILINPKYTKGHVYCTDHAKNFRRSTSLTSSNLRSLEASSCRCQWQILEDVPQKLKDAGRKQFKWFPDLDGSASRELCRIA